jgi:neutral ceramidase
MPRFRLILLIATLLVLGGCISEHIKTKSYPVPLATPSQHFIAGAGKTEITPPIGYPMGGHSLAAGMARGYWTRLYARSFYFQDAGGHQLVLVSADLFAIPAGLRARVLELLSRLKPQDSLPQESLVISATHTHLGPGNFATSSVYNSFASPLPGFDKDLFEYLAHQIANSITSAIKDANDHASEIHSIAFHQGLACGMLRNRAIGPFLSDDPNVQDGIVKQGSLCRGRDEALSNCKSDQACLRLLAVDPTLYVLEIRRGTGASASVRGVLVFLAVHGTAMSHDSPVYTADHPGIAVSKMESQLEGKGIVGFFNGAEGDVSPRWSRQDARDMLSIGDLFYSHISDTLNTIAISEETDPNISALYSEIPRDVPSLSQPEMGVATIGGAEDGRTFLYHYGWHEGVVSSEARGNHDGKIPGLDQPTFPLTRFLKITSLFSHPRDFPTLLPVMLIRIGNTVSIGTVPAEMTTAMGWQLRETLSRMEAPRKFVLAGLSNEYFSYITTSKEFDLQAYEGASTALGKEEGRVLIDRLSNMSSELKAGQGNPRKAVQARNFNAGPAFSRGLLGKLSPSRFDREHFIGDEGLESLIPDDVLQVSPDTPRFDWWEPPADLQGYAWTPSRDLGEYISTPARNFLSRSVTLIDAESHEEIVNDQSPAFLTLTLGKGDLLEAGEAPGESSPFLVWRAILRSASSMDRNRRYRFKVITADGRICTSQAFGYSDHAAEHPIRVEWILSAPDCMAHR